MKYLLLVSFLMLVGCASQTPGNRCQVKEGENPQDLSVNMDTDMNYSYGNFMFYNFTFENDSEEWVRVKNVEIQEFPENKDAKIIVGADLASWATSMNRRLAIQGYNTGLLLGALAITATAAGAYAGAKGNTAGATAGIAGAIGVVGVASANDMMKTSRNLELASLVPSEHIYTPFSVAPHLVTAKWLLVEFPKNVVPCKLNIDVTFIDGRKATYTGKINAYQCVAEGETKRMPNSYYQR